MPPPANDNFANALAITGASGTTAGVDNTSATVEAGEPSGSGVHNYHSVWFKWTAPDSGPVVFSTGASVATGGGPLDTTLTVWVGTSLGALAQVAVNDDNPDAPPGPPWDYTSKVAFSAVAGTDYYLQVGAYSTADVGTVILAWETPPLPTFSSIQFGDYLDVSDLGDGKIRVDSKGGDPAMPFDASITTTFDFAAPVAGSLLFRPVWGNPGDSTSHAISWVGDQPYYHVPTEGPTAALPAPGSGYRRENLIAFPPLASDPLAGTWHEVLFMVQFSTWTLEGDADYGYDVSVNASAQMVAYEAGEWHANAGGSSLNLLETTENIIARPPTTLSPDTKVFHTRSWRYLCRSETGSPSGPPGITMWGFAVRFAFLTDDGVTIDFEPGGMGAWIYIKKLQFPFPDPFLGQPWTPSPEGVNSISVDASWNNYGTLLVTTDDQPFRDVGTPGTGGWTTNIPRNHFICLDPGTWQFVTTGTVTHSGPTCRTYVDILHQTDTPATGTVLHTEHLLDTTMAAGGTAPISHTHTWTVAERQWVALALGHVNGTSGPLSHFVGSIALTKL